MVGTRLPYGRTTPRKVAKVSPLAPPGVFTVAGGVAVEQMNRSWKDLGSPWRPQPGPEEELAGDAGGQPPEPAAGPAFGRRASDRPPAPVAAGGAATDTPGGEQPGGAFAPSLGAVLVVHADERERLRLLSHLRQAGLQAFGAASGTEALSAHQLHQHAVVVVDLDLPGLDGAELTRRLKERIPATAVLLLAHPEGLLRAAASVGLADGCMVQPPDRHHLVTWVRRYLEHDELRSAHRLLLQRIDQVAAQQGLFDPLTGLPNRPMLDGRLQEALADAAATGRQVAVLFVDLDGFKAVNDVLGHHAGDALLKEIAGRLVAGRRDTDTVARFGGDEFVVVCPAIYDPAAAIDITEGLLADLAQPLVADGYEHRVTASVGVAVSGPGADTPESLLRNADLAMYRAKDDGRSRWALFEESMLQDALSRYATRQRLRHATSNGELHLLYQPIIDLEQGTLAGAEALVRWHPPGEPMAPPESFLDIAEEVGLIRRIGDWVIDQALTDLATWRGQVGLPAGFRLWINVWARQVADPALPNVLLELLQRHGLAPAAVGLDVADGVLADEAGVRVLRDLSAAGVAISIDDFGSRAGELAMLGQVPLTLLKLDRRLVAALSGEGGRRQVDLLRAVVGVGLALGIPVMAKGVETHQQATAVRAVGCSFGQGYLFGGPGEPSELPGLTSTSFLSEDALG